MTPLTTPELVGAIALGLAACAWATCVVVSLLGLRSMPDATSPPTDDSVDAPSVSIVLAARDEAARVEQTVRRALAQTDVRARVIAIDDRSTDGTGAILERLAREDERLIALRIDSLPEGWLGKCHALHVGARRATHEEWLLFIDADTWLAPGAARAGVDLAKRANAGHVCFAPSMSSTTLPGRATLLAGMALMACNAWSVHSRWLPGYVGVGAYNLVRADIYRSFGGHEPLRMEVLDDVKLGLLANRAGARTGVTFAPELVEVEWAGSARGFVRLLEKNAFATQGFSTTRTIVLATLGAALLLSPWVGLLVTMIASHPFVRAAGVAVVVAHLATLLPSALIARRFGWGAQSVVASPLGFWVALLAGVNSAARTLAAGGVRWRETFYPLKALRRGLVR
jgi:hypothetical protein